MKAWGALLVPLLAAAGVAVCWLLEVPPRVADWWRIRRGRERVHAVVERETGRHVGELVPGQRGPSDPQPWADLIDWRDGDVR